jgi:hypothetical protein
MASFRVLFAGTVSLASLTGSFPEGPRCSLGTPLGPIRHDTYLVQVRPVRDSARVAMGEDTWARMSSNMKARPAGSWAQKFVVLRAAPPGGTSPTLAPGDTVQVVPWGYVADCSMVPWQGSATWVTDSVVVFRLTTPRTDLPTGTPLTFDELGWHAPYPSGAFLQFRLRGDTVRSNWVPPSAYFDFVASLPRLGPADPLMQPTAQVQEAIEAWALAHPEHAERHPVRTLRRRAR